MRRLCRTKNVTSTSQAIRDVIINYNTSIILSSSLLLFCVSGGVGGTSTRVSDKREQSFRSRTTYTHIYVAHKELRRRCERIYTTIKSHPRACSRIIIYIIMKCLVQEHSMTYEQFIPSPDRRQTCNLSYPQKTISLPPSAHQSQQRVYNIYECEGGRMCKCVCVLVWVCV